MPEQPTSENELIVAVKNALDRLIQAVTSYQEANSAQREKELNAESKAVVRLPIEVTKYYESEERERSKTNRRDKTRMGLEIVGVTAAVVLAVLTLLTLIIFNGQLTEMRKQSTILQQQAVQSTLDSAQQLAIAKDQAKAAQDSADAITRQMRQDQRPWMIVKLNPPLTQNGSQIIGITENQPLIFPLLVNDIGKTAAKNYDASMFVEVVKNGGSPRLNSPKVPPWILSGGIMFPNASAGTFAVRRRWKGTLEENDPLTPTEHKSLLDGTSYIAIYGVVTYGDVFGIKHWTNFCMAIPFSNQPYTAINCAEYNTVDSN